MGATITTIRNMAQIGMSRNIDSIASWFTTSISPNILSMMTFPVTYKKNVIGIYLVKNDQSLRVIPGTINHSDFGICRRLNIGILSQ